MFYDRYHVKRNAENDANSLLATAFSREAYPETKDVLHDLMENYLVFIGSNTDNDVLECVMQNNNVAVHKVYTSENLGSKIVDFNYAGDESEATFVRTENKIFRNEALNRKDCREYIDIDCQFEFAEDATLTKHYDRILAYNGSTLITDYLKVFRVGGKVKEDEEEEE